MLLSRYSLGKLSDNCSQIADLVLYKSSSVTIRKRNIYFSKGNCSILYFTAACASDAEDGVMMENPDSIWASSLLNPWCCWMSRRHGWCQCRLRLDIFLKICKFLQGDMAHCPWEVEFSFDTFCSCVILHHLCICASLWPLNSGTRLSRHEILSFLLYINEQSGGIFISICSFSWKSYINPFLSLPKFIKPSSSLL